jgi:hypothetical protein
MICDAPVRSSAARQEVISRRSSFSWAMPRS